MDSSSSVDTLRELGVREFGHEERENCCLKERLSQSIPKWKRTKTPRFCMFCCFVCCMFLYVFVRLLEVP